MNRILVLEDEPLLNEMMSEFLRNEGFKVTSCASYDKALCLAYENHFDLLIFDVKIIGGNGFELLCELRKSGVGTPCIFTTSLNGISDVKKGFDAGCDDYIKKPFELAELGLRVKNILKRKFLANGEGRVKIASKFEFDTIKKELFCEGEMVNLSKKERDLLSLLLQNRGQILSKELILNQIWEFDEMPNEGSLRVYIVKLRKILGESVIKNHSKIGYEFVG